VRKDVLSMVSLFMGVGIWLGTKSQLTTYFAARAHPGGSRPSKVQTMTEGPLHDLLGLLNLETLDTNRFRAYHPPDRQRRLYGGQIMAQALVAAARSSPSSRQVHSLHGYFLRPGDPKEPALIEVECIRDGRSFTTRRVVVKQAGRAIFTMDVSLQERETGLSHQLDMPAGLAPPTDGKIPGGFAVRPFIAWRYDHKKLLRDEPHEARQSIWFKTTSPVPDEPLLHAALLVYESDNVLLGTARMPHKGSFQREDMQVASLDHAVWLHREFRVDEWLLYVVDSPSASGARGYTRGMIYRADGALVASTMQEGLIRHRRG